MISPPPRFVFFRNEGVNVLFFFKFRYNCFAVFYARGVLLHNSNTTAFIGQMFMQFPQCRQFSCLIDAFCPFNTIQLCGHTERHFPKPMQSSVIKYPSISVRPPPNENEKRSIGFFERSNHSPCPSYRQNTISAVRLIAR